MVVASILESMQSCVVIVTRDSEAKLLLSEDEITKGMIIEEKIVEDLRLQHAVFISDKN